MDGEGGDRANIVSQIWRGSVAMRGLWILRWQELVSVPEVIVVLVRRRRSLYVSYACLVSICEGKVQDTIILTMLTSSLCV